jgi:alpha-1,3-rhamnosyl/mannosyltransferase
MPEVAGDSAFLVDPHNIEELAAAMQCLATDQNFASHLRWKGRARAEEFRWDTCAEEVARIYERLGSATSRGHGRLQPEHAALHTEES